MPQWRIDITGWNFDDAQHFLYWAGRLEDMSGTLSRVVKEWPYPDDPTRLQSYNGVKREGDIFSEKQPRYHEAIRKVKAAITHRWDTGQSIFEFEEEQPTQ